MAAPKRYSSAETSSGESVTSSFATFLKTIEPADPNDPDAVMNRILASLRQDERQVAQLIEAAGGSLSRLEESLARLVRLGLVAQSAGPDGFVYRLTKQGEAAAGRTG